MRPPLTCKPLLPPEPLPLLDPLLLPLPELPLLTDPLLLPLPPSDPLPLLDPPLLPLSLPELLPLVDPPPLPLLVVLSVPRFDPAVLDDDEEHPVASAATPAPRKTARPDGWSFMDASPLCSHKVQPSTRKAERSSEGPGDAPAFERAAARR